MGVGFATVTGNSDGSGTGFTALVADGLPRAPPCTATPESATAGGGAIGRDQIDQSECDLRSRRNRFAGFFAINRRANAARAAGRRRATARGSMICAGGSNSKFERAMSAPLPSNGNFPDSIS